MPSSREKRAKRERIWKKSKVCFVCQQEITHLHEATLEHIVPKWLGGTYRMRNLAISHHECNQLRGPIICRVELELKLWRLGTNEMEKAYHQKKSYQYEDLYGRE